MEISAAALIAFLAAAYALTGADDFGKGIWDLFANGERAVEQRRAIRGALEPFWEVNHVWLVGVLVMLFSAFPRAFAALGTALAVPFFLFLLAVILRGSAFVFQGSGALSDGAYRRWGQVFGFASALAAVLLGVVPGALSGGRLRADPVTGLTSVGLWEAWLFSAPIFLGVFVFCLTAFNSAVGLARASATAPLQEDFRRKALGAGGAAGLAGAWAFTAGGVPFSGGEVPFFLGALLWVFALAALFTRCYKTARRLVQLQTICLFLGWALAQFPNLITPDITVQNAAAPAGVLKVIVIAMGLGLLVLFPALYALHGVFRGPQNPRSND